MGHSPATSHNKTPRFLCVDRVLLGIRSAVWNVQKDLSMIPLSSALLVALAIQLFASECKSGSDPEETFDRPLVCGRNQSVKAPIHTCRVCLEFGSYRPFGNTNKSVGNASSFLEAAFEHFGLITHKLPLTQMQIPTE